MPAQAEAASDGVAQMTPLPGRLEGSATGARGARGARLSSGGPNLVGATGCACSGAALSLSPVLFDASFVFLWTVHRTPAAAPATAAAEVEREAPGVDTGVRSQP